MTTVAWLNVPTVDGRVLRTVTWRDLPLPVMQGERLTGVDRGGWLGGRVDAVRIDGDRVEADITWRDGEPDWSQWAIGLDFDRMEWSAIESAVFSTGQAPMIFVQARLVVSTVVPIWAALWRVDP